MAILKNLQQENERLAAELAALKAAKDSSIIFKVSQKGAVSAYGLGRWPVTLYRGQWEALLERSSDILAFIEANASRLSVKEPK